MDVHVVERFANCLPTYFVLPTFVGCPGGTYLQGLITPIRHTYVCSLLVSLAGWLIGCVSMVYVHFHTVSLLFGYYWHQATQFDELLSWLFSN